VVEGEAREGTMERRSTPWAAEESGEANESGGLSTSAVFFLLWAEAILFFWMLKQLQKLSLSFLITRIRDF
jgi:hypothetical protein